MTDHNKFPKGRYASDAVGPQEPPKHTPGPWNFAGPYLNSGPHPTTNTVTLLGPIKENGGQRVLGHLYFNCPNEPEWEQQFHANCHLISAAPDLLAGLKGIFELMDAGLICRDISMDHHPDWAVRAIRVTEKLKAAYDAVMKAEGRI